MSVALILAGRNTTSLQGIMYVLCMCEKYGAAEYRYFVRTELYILQDFRQHHKHSEN